MSGEKVTSIIIFASYGLEYTKACVESVLKYTRRPFELILVDVGASDGTTMYFNSLPKAKVVSNQACLGFAKLYNQAVKLASGDYLLLLNGTTVVTANWLDNLVTCIESDAKIGLAGPMTNAVAGNQVVRVPYGASIVAMHKFAKRFNKQDKSRHVEVDKLAGFCLIARKPAVEKVGLLPDDTGAGGLDDVGYCSKVLDAGFKLVRAGDTFIHHYGDATANARLDGSHALKQRSGLVADKYSRNNMGSVNDLMVIRPELVRIAEQRVYRNPIEVYSERYMQEPWRFPDKYVESPTLSLVVLVKNDEDTIGRCLSSVKDAVDEIIVVDIGSTDRTIEIANLFDAKVFFYEWTGDLARARSTAMEHATCDWVMFLEAHEELVREDAIVIRELLEDSEREGFFFNEFNLINEDDAIIDLAFRLWRNKPEYRRGLDAFNQVADLIHTGNLATGFTRIRINRYSYLCTTGRSEYNSHNNLNALNALLKEIAKKSDNTVARFNIGGVYVQRSDYEKALENYKKAFANLSSLDVVHASKLVRNIAICLKQLGRFREALKVLKDAREAYQDYTDLFYIEGLIHTKRADHAAAIKSFSTALEADPFAGRVYVGHPGIGGYMAAYQLAKAYLSSGNEKEAVIEYKRALEYNPRYSLALVELGSLLMRREGPGGLKQSLESYSDINSEEMLLSLASVFNQAGYYDIGLEYLDKLAGATYNPAEAALLRGQCLLNTKRYREAADVLGGIAKSSRLYPAASVDKVLCSLLQGEYESVYRATGTIQDWGNYSLVGLLYRALADVLNGRKATVEIDVGRSEEARQLTVDLLRKLLELGESKAFRKAATLLDVLGVSAGEISLFLGKIYYDVGRNDMAVEELIKAYEAGCADGEAFFILGRTSLGNDFYEEARTFFFEALNNGIEEISLYVSLGRTLTKLGELDKAAEILDEGAGKYPSSPLIKQVKESIGILV